MRVALCLLLVLGVGIVNAQLKASLLPLNATCTQINALKYKCVDLEGTCDTYDQALSAAVLGETVLVCQDDARCVSSKCKRLARLGETCDNTLGCFDKTYDVQCDTVCRGKNVYGAGEPASFQQGAICDISATSDVRNGGCYEGSTPTNSLVCSPTSQTCSSAATGSPCPIGLECLSSDYCDLSGVCVKRFATACNFSTPLRYGDECTADTHCRPDDVCAQWFSGTVGTACSINEDCDAGLYCNGGKCATGTTTPKACNSPADDTCAIDEVCVCNKGNGACTSLANTVAYKTAWLALTKCVKTNKCFPVVPGTNGAISTHALTFFKGGCYDTFCRKEWLALTDKEALCSTSAAALYVPSLLALALSALAAVIML